jgi:uncharacterized membrane protein YkvA (DUF1232 family)
MRKLLFVLWRISKADLRLLWFALKHRNRPGWLIPATLGLAAYAMDPFNLVIPVLGVVDDMVLIPLVLHSLLKLLPAPILDGFDRQG